MGNETSSEVVGVRTIRTHTSKGFIRTLTDMYHVPSLKRNVKSLGNLDANGCSI